MEQDDIDGQDGICRIMMTSPFVFFMVEYATLLPNIALQDIMNFNVVYIFSTYHSLFYITGTLIMGILSQRCFQNLIGRRIICTVISPSLFQSWCTFLDLCVNFLFFFERMNCRGSINIQSSYGCHYLLSQFRYTTNALILFQIIFSSVLPIILKGEACENNCCFMSVKTQFNVPNSGYHETYLSNFSLRNRSFSSFSSLSLCHSCY